jgi:hypothetical protein
VSEDKGHRAFYHYGAAWYADAVRDTSREADKVNFGIYHDEGGTSGEMAMTWRVLNNHEPPAARLECFEDAWAVLATMPDLVDALGNLDGENPQPKEFCALLVSLGFKDETPRVFPDEEAEGETRRLRSVARGLDFDRMGVKQLRRLIEAARPSSGK